MNKRLVWNFELDLQDSDELSKLPCLEKETLRWESRFFWPENRVITLYGLKENCLHLANFESKYRHDTYYILADRDYNIKSRRNELLYKPLIKTTGVLQGFEKKINLQQQEATTLLPGTPPILTRDLMHLLKTNALAITIEKDAFIYKFNTEPSTKLELSRLTIEGKVYFSACIEGKSAPLVIFLSQILLKREHSSDYVRFLKNRGIHD